MSISEEKRSLAIIRAIMWGFAGFLYSAVFLVVWRYVDLTGTGWWHVPFAAAVAGAFVSAFYSAKRAAIAGALAGTISSQAMLVYYPAVGGLKYLALAALGTGLVFGVLASFVYERRRGSLAVVVSGAVTGCVAGVVIKLVGLLVPGPLQPLVFTFLLVPVTGVLFYLAALQQRVRRPTLPQFLPHPLSVGLAAAWVAVVVAGSMWFLALSLSYNVEPAMQEAMQAVFGEFPLALLGGILGGALAGAAMELVGVRWVSRI